MRQSSRPAVPDDAASRSELPTLGCCLLGISEVAEGGFAQCGVLKPNCCIFLAVSAYRGIYRPTSQGADADTARMRALAAYQDFLTLWKDADPEVPILKQAKAEYAKLQ